MNFIWSSIVSQSHFYEITNSLGNILFWLNHSHIYSFLPPILNISGSFNFTFKKLFSTFQIIISFLTSLLGQKELLTFHLVVVKVQVRQFIIDFVIHVCWLRYFSQYWFLSRHVLSYYSFFAQMTVWNLDPSNHHSCLSIYGIKFFCWLATWKWF